MMTRGFCTKGSISGYNQTFKRYLCSFLVFSHHLYHSSSDIVDTQLFPVMKTSIQTMYTNEDNSISHKPT